MGPDGDGLPDEGEDGDLPPRLVRRTAEGVANLVAQRMGGRKMEINAAWLPLLAPITRTIAPLAYQRAMRAHSGTG